MGAEPEQFALGAKRLVEAGFAVIDINFGCPVKKVLGRCRGGYHLSQPDIALEIVARTRDVVPVEIPVTLKMRRGLDDSNESRDNFYRILDGLCLGSRSYNCPWSDCVFNVTTAPVAGSF